MLNKEKADLKAVVEDNCKHLSVPEETKLLGLLTEFEELFDGTLGDWDSEPVSLQLKEGKKPYHGGAFSIPKVKGDTIEKVVKRLCELGVLKWQPESEWISPSLIVPKRNKPYGLLVILGKSTKIY